MGLGSKIKEILSSNARFMAATGTFLAAQAADYLATLQGLETISQFREITEANWGAEQAMQVWGPETGLFYYKLALCSIVVSLAKKLDYDHKLGETKWKAEHLLYGGAIATAALGALPWLYIVYDYMKNFEPFLH